jgi:hypothetical protein
MMRKFHKTDNLRFEKRGIPSNVLKTSDLYNRRIVKYDRNKDKRRAQQKIEQDLEELDYNYNNP